MPAGDFMVRVEKGPTATNPVKIVKVEDLTGKTAEELKPPVDAVTITPPAPVVPENEIPHPITGEGQQLATRITDTPAPDAPWRGVKVPDPQRGVQAPQVVVRPLELKYVYQGNCPYCKDVGVETIELEDVITVKRNKFQQDDQGKVINSKIVVVAWCPKCKRKARQRQVYKL